MNRLIRILEENKSTIGLVALILLSGWVLMSLIQPAASTLSWVVLVLGALTALAWGWLDRAALAGLFSSRRARKGLRLSATLFLVFGVLAFSYFLFSKYLIVRLDVTANKRFSLSAQTEQVVRSVEEKVRFTVFKVKVPDNAPENVARQYQMGLGLVQQFEDTLKEVARKNSKIEWEAVDMLEEPALREKYKVEQPFTIVVTAGAKTKVLTIEDYVKTEMVGQRPQMVPKIEEALTGALISLTKKKQFTVLFSVGHGEKDPNKSEQFGAAQLKSSLAQEGLVIRSTNLLTARQIADDVDLLIVAGPRDPVSEKALASIEAYLNSGRPAIFMAERESPASWRAFLSRWGVDVADNTLVDLYANARNPLAIFGAYGYHEITTKLAEDNRVAVFYMASGIDKSAVARGTKNAAGAETSPFAVQTLLTTGDKAWGETDNPLRDGSQFTPGEKQGKMDLAYAVTRNAEKVESKDGKVVVTEPGPKKRLRYVVFGDSDWVADQLFFAYPGNKDLMLNAVNWALGQEQDITIRPKSQVSYPLTLTPAELNFIKYFSWFLLPLAVIVPGVLIWLRRRKNG